MPRICNYGAELYIITTMGVKRESFRRPIASLFHEKILKHKYRAQNCGLMCTGGPCKFYLARNIWVSERSSWGWWWVCMTRPSTQPSSRLIHLILHSAFTFNGGNERYDQVQCPGTLLEPNWFHHYVTGARGQWVAAKRQWNTGYWL